MDAPPPSYDAATGSSSGASSSRPNVTSKTSTAGGLKPRNTIPAGVRRSMEDEHRALPEGWVRQYDVAHSHQFFVDTRANPPRSLWHHPYDDDQYLASLTPQERDHIMETKKVPTKADIVYHSTDEEDEDHEPDSRSKNTHAQADLDQAYAGNGKQKVGFGRKVKDKLTQSTHEEREAARRERAREEEEMYRQHQAFRNAMTRAIQTGQPQPLGRDRQGHDVFLQPPNGAIAPQGSRYLNPYSQGPYANPNARFIKAPPPQNAYNRPYGGGYGGGYGMPLGLMGGGLLGGVLLGGLLF